MKISIRKTKDNSFTLYNEHFKDFYHSTEGALSESLHIYINNGLKKCSKKNINIFEMGFGTGLNALLTFEYATQNNLFINYFALEKFPVPQKIIDKLKLPQEKQQFVEFFFQLHQSQWNKKIKISPNFVLKKIQADIVNFQFDFKFDLCYYDAFSYNSQPELWDKKIFEKIFDAMEVKGILITYSSKGIVKQNLRAAGFTIKRFKGFGKKWHNLSAEKI